MGENQGPCVKVKQRLQVDVRRVTFHPGWKMRDTSLMTSNIPPSQHSNLNRLHVLIQTHIFFSLCNEGWCWPPKEPVHTHQGPQPAHIQPAHIQPPKPNPPKASAHLSYIHIGTSLPTIKNQPDQVAEEATELRSLQNNHIIIYSLFRF